MPVHQRRHPTRKPWTASNIYCTNKTKQGIQRKPLQLSHGKQVDAYLRPAAHRATRVLRILYVRGMRHQLLDDTHAHGGTEYFNHPRNIFSYFCEGERLKYSPNLYGTRPGISSYSLTGGPLPLGSECRQINHDRRTPYSFQPSPGTVLGRMQPVVVASSGGMQHISRMTPKLSPANTAQHTVRRLTLRSSQE